MATVTATDFLVATGTPGLWVRLHSNVSGTDYYSTAVSDPQGSFTYSVPAGDYSLYTGIAATVPGTPTLRSAHYQVAIRNGDDGAVNSLTSTIGPYTPQAAAGFTDALIADRGGQVYNTSSARFGTLANGQTVTDGVMNGTTGVLTSVSGKFVAGDVGKSIFVIGAGAAGVPLRTTIASYQSATQVTLTAVSATAVGAAVVDWGQNAAATINTACTTASAAGGGTVFSPSGAYHIDTPGVILQSNIQFQGAGQGLTVFSAALSGLEGILNTTQSGSSKTVYSNIGISDLTVRSANGHATSFYNINRFSVQNCELYFNAGPVLIEGLYIEHCQHVTVLGNYVHDFNGDGILINSTDHFMVASNLILGGANADDLIDIDRDFNDTGLIPSRYGTVVGNVCRHSLGASQPGNGIRVEDSQYVTVVGNTVDDITNGNGIVVNSAVATITTKFVTIVGNTISSCLINGIKVAPESTGGAFKQVVVSGNIIDTCGQAGGTDVRAGIQVGGVTGAAQAGSILVTGNYLDNCGKGDGNGGGIVLYKSGASNTAVIANFVSNTTAGSLGGIAAWNGDAGQTYTNVTIAWNHMVNNGTDYNAECTSQAGITLIFYSATAGATFVKQLSVKANLVLDGSGVTANQNWILMGPIANFTGGNFIQQQTTTSAFAGTGILQNFANGSGTFTGNFLRSQVNSVDKHVLAATGIAQHAAQVYPGTPLLAVQTNSGLLAGTGAPNNANGNNGDIYFNAAGAAGTTVYQKRVGAWVGIV